MKLKSIYIPIKIKIIIWEKNTHRKIYLYNNSKNFKIILKNRNFVLDKWSNSLVSNNNINKKNIENIENFFKTLNDYFFNKIKFKGKGFRIKHFKKTKIIKFFFGRSHKTIFLLNKIKKKKINKYKFIIYNINKKELYKLSKNIKNIKNINFYTLRGIRSYRQIIFKRKGKKGTYI